MRTRHLFVSLGAATALAACSAGAAFASTPDDEPDTPVAQICAATSIEGVDALLRQITDSSLLGALDGLAFITVPEGTDGLEIDGAIDLGQVKQTLGCDEDEPTPPADLDCDDFPLADDRTAQDVLDETPGEDPHGLDSDGDRVACEVDEDPAPTTPPTSTPTPDCGCPDDDDDDSSDDGRNDDDDDDSDDSDSDSSSDSDDDDSDDSDDDNDDDSDDDDDDVAFPVVAPETGGE